MTELDANNFKRKCSSDSRRPKNSERTVSPPPPYESVDKTETTNISPKNDEDLVSAAEVLTLLTSRTCTPPSGDMINSSACGFVVDNQNSMTTNPSTQHPLVSKVNKVTKHPLVTNAVKYYENSKRNYAPFNYAAEIVENVAFPVVSKIELNLNNRHIARQLRKEEVASQAGTSSKDFKNKKRRLSSFNEKIPQSKLKDHSVERKRRLQFCLQILRLANDNINSKVSVLQQKVIEKEKEVKQRKSHQLQDGRGVLESSQQPLSQERNLYVEPKLSNDATRETETEIVTTVKKIIRLISNFRPSSLSPEQTSPTSNSEDSAENTEFKSTIRDIILKLPRAIQQNSAHSETPCQQTNDKIIVLAKESLDMIGRLTTVFNDQLERAEVWVAGSEWEPSSATEDHKLQTSDREFSPNQVADDKQCQ
ncbi:uncharacterized protein PRCAT00001211001 [Priceomyces carsonii]|uniref:uncharacterized protein n=1 Tax=Priceomyces carsonii TaxID=28549 RepID=UPI002EDA00C1|nr:unnamed protein product [Priceomyces carsonii]